MAFYKYDGGFLKAPGGFAKDAACCCEPPDCAEASVGFSYVIGNASFPDASPCTSPCDPPNVHTPNSGPTYWDFFCAEDNGWTYSIWRKPGFPGSCQDCNPATFDPTGYVNVGGMGGAVTNYRLDRTLPGSCNADNYRCFWVIATHIATGTECYICPESTTDTDSCPSCCSIVIESSGTCIPFGGGTSGTASISATFAITIPEYGASPDCPDIFPSVTWQLFIGGIEVATGSGLTGSGSGDSSCSCPTEDPCEVSGEVSVTWCSGDVCCTS